MNEYIEREAAYELARTSKYYSDFHRSMADLTSLKELLDDTPTADVVKVVRCKDCLYNAKGTCVHSESYDDTTYHPDFYCADGIREDVEE